MIFLKPDLGFLFFVYFKFYNRKHYKITLLKEIMAIKIDYKKYLNIYRV